MTSFARCSGIGAPLVALLSLVALGGASATVPGEVQYQGLLLDNVGTPITAAVDLDFELFDALTGGTSLWSESHAGVSVLDGVYEVSLGATTPLDTSVLGGGAVYLEVSANSETMTPRQRLLAVPYALQAQHAADTDAVAGLGAAFVTEMYEHFDFDGDPPSTDPREGLGDADGDGIANFIDPDNDNDGISDAAEELQSSDINVPTPTLTGVLPTSARSCLSTNVQVQGSAFEPGLTVVFGSESPAASSVTPTSFDVSVGPQTPGFADVTVTNPSGEFATATGAFEFSSVTPAISGFVPPSAQALYTTTVLVQGSDFEPSVSVAFGSQTPTPYDVTSTSFKVDVGPQPTGAATVTVTNLCGEQATDPSFVFNNDRIVFVTSTQYDGNLGGVAGADALCASHAASAGLNGSFLAWLADGVTDPATRFDLAAGPYTMLDGTTIADDWADLTDGAIASAFGVTENAVLLLDQSNVWTGVAADGTAVNAADPNTHCNGFTDNATFTGSFGNTLWPTERWTFFSPFPVLTCSGPKRIFCFQQ